MPHTVTTPYAELTDTIPLGRKMDHARYSLRQERRRGVNGGRSRAPHREIVTGASPKLHQRTTEVTRIKGTFSAHTLRRSSAPSQNLTRGTGRPRRRWGHGTPILHPTTAAQANRLEGAMYLHERATISLLERPRAAARHRAANTDVAQVQYHKPPRPDEATDTGR